MNVAQSARLVANYLGASLSATLRHVWLATSLRADWRQLSDTCASFVWFGTVAIACSLLRWWVFGEMTIGNTVLSVLLSMGLVTVVLERGDRSSAGVLMCWAVSAGIDITAILLTAVGFNTSTGEVAWFLVCAELAMQYITAIEFLRLPDTMRKRGYAPPAVPPESLTSDEPAPGSGNGLGGPQP